MEIMVDFPLESKEFNPFGALIGLNFTKAENGKSECVIKANETLFNPHKVVHGGVVYSMADTGMGGALYSLLEKSESCATIEIKSTYIKPVKSGNLVCDTKIIHKSKRIAILESEIRNNGILVAKANGTYIIFEKFENI